MKVIGGCRECHAGNVVTALETLLGYGQVVKVFDASQWHDKFDKTSYGYVFASQVRAIMGRTVVL